MQYAVLLFAYTIFTNKNCQRNGTELKQKLKANLKILECCSAIII